MRWPLNKLVPDLTGKVALVTGANSPDGIGFHTAYQMASKGAKVYIGARSIAKADSAIKEMRQANPNIAADKVSHFVADLGNLKEVKASSQRLMKAESRLDILVHNAAILSMPLELDSDGISVQFATNHLGPFVLTNELMPLIKRTTETIQDVRVVMVSAGTYAFPPLGTRFDSLARFNIEMEATKYGDAAFMRYGLSKLANLLFTRELQKTFDVTGINAIAVALHPGLIITDGTRKMVGPENQHKLQGRMTPMEGATTTLFAATNPKVWTEKQAFGGAYLMPPGKIEEPVGNGSNDGLAKELWDTSERVVNDVLAKRS